MTIKGNLANTYNRLFYGPDAPLFGEQVWIKPRKEVRRALRGNFIRFFKSRASPKWLFHNRGYVVNTPFPEKFCITVEQLPKFSYMVNRFQNGLPWSNTGLKEFIDARHAIKDSETSFSSSAYYFETRKRELDLLFTAIQREGRVKDNAELDALDIPGKRAEQLIHLGPDGEIFFSGGGWHRFAIAWILDLPYPVTVGLVHRCGIETLVRLRRRGSFELQRGDQ